MLPSGYVLLSFLHRINIADFKTMSGKSVTSGKAIILHICTVKSLIKTAGGKDIWVLITIGTGIKTEKPGLQFSGESRAVICLEKNWHQALLKLFLRNQHYQKI